MIAGLDTGFFIALDARQEDARSVWRQIVADEHAGVISCLSLYELQKQGLKGVLHREVAEGFVEELPHVCETVWLSESTLLNRSARLSHGTGLAMANAIILASVLDADADVLYTTDSDFEVYTAGPEIRLL
jgi:predicted nucleic acid-binding protein